MCASFGVVRRLTRGCDGKVRKDIVMAISDMSRNTRSVVA